MAVISYVSTQLQTYPARTWRIVWGPMANGDTGQPLEHSAAADRSVQVEGTFGAAGNARIEGSNMDITAAPTFRTLHDPQGTALDITTAGLKEVAENTGAIRPNITAGDGTTAITITLHVRSTL